MFLVLATVMLQAAPPVVQAAPPPLPPPIVSGPTPGRFGTLRPVDLQVRITSGSQVLLEEPLRLAPGGSNIRRSRSEGFAASCPPTPGTRTESLYFALSPIYEPAGTTPVNGNRARLSLNWSRPPAGACGTGTRSLQIEDPGIILEPGRTVTIDGDGDVRISIRVLDR
ncbi:hypothetical protein [Sphingomonas sp. LHG3406-1]|uniref:hypothetical protein n=1 Tax=Sphingomonas sp. LHG3406-1 TaxID=2804617 RepID=UPI002636C0AF|nr:hypothetical protein [Sphingomonas sp. LHG3406-1]